MSSKFKSQENNEKFNKDKLNTIQQQNSQHNDHQIQRYVATTPFPDLLGHSNSKKQQIINRTILNKNKQPLFFSKTPEKQTLGSQRINDTRHKRNKTQTKVKQNGTLSSALYIPFLQEFKKPVNKINYKVKKYQIKTRQQIQIQIKRRKSLIQQKRKQKSLSLPNIIQNGNEKNLALQKFKIKKLETLNDQKIFLSKLNSYSNKNQKNIKQFKMKKINTNREVIKNQSQWDLIKFLDIKTKFYQLQKNLQNKKGNSFVQSQHKKYADTMYRPKTIRIQKFPQNTDDVAKFIKHYESIRTKKKSVKQNSEINQLIKQKNFCIQFNEKQSLYFGQIHQGRYHGQGILLKPNYLFQGKWENGIKISGVQAKRSGYYQGSFLDDKRQGFGKYIWNNGTQQYSGQWKNGQKHGNGVWKNLKGDQYVGQWIQGKVEGYGVHITSQGQKYQGKAKERFPNGDIFEGIYSAGKPQGYGVYKFKKYKIVFQGNFHQGLRNGFGRLVVPNYINFEGQFKNDRVQGYGKLYFENKDNYLGNFKNGKRHGNGSFHKYNQNKTYNGLWQNDQFCQNQDNIVINK